MSNRMGIYWQTVFYSDINDMNNKIVLSNIDPIIDENDVARGYVDKDELLKYFGNKINKGDVGDHSYVVEYSWSTYDIDNKLLETRRFKVKTI